VTDAPVIFLSESEILAHSSFLCNSDVATFGYQK